VEEARRMLLQWCSRHPGWELVVDNSITRIASGSRHGVDGKPARRVGMRVYFVLRRRSDGREVAWVADVTQSSQDNASNCLDAALGLIAEAEQLI